MESNNKYIYDALYGSYCLPDVVWNVIPTAELQRLREVRLCNINSLCLTGGANINRYEHAIGTCHLAQQCLETWPLLTAVSVNEQENFLLAALLHDVVSAGFGHSVEYIESQLGFDHETAFLDVITGRTGGPYTYKSTTLEPIFFGMPRSIPSRISEKDLKAIGESISGQGRFGPLINGTMDLDNIDNVFRLAYHMGITKSGDIPLNLARSLWVENGELVVKEESIPLIEEWHNVRKKLYKLLLLNPQEFAAKCMLTEAIEIAKSQRRHPFNWYDVDFVLFQELGRVSSETASLVARIMRGDLYGCIGVFSATDTAKQSMLADRNSRTEIEERLGFLIRSKFGPRFKSAMVALHLIVDVNKTERQIDIKTNRGQFIQVGNRSNQLLIGAFFKNVGLSMYDIDRINGEITASVRREILTALRDFLVDNTLREVNLYSESREC